MYSLAKPRGPWFVVSNEVGMGIVPLQFINNENFESLGLTGRETFDIGGLSVGLEPHAELTVTGTRRFARRQDSWFRKDPRISWVGWDDPDRVDDRHVLLREVAEEGVFVSREHARELLQRVEARTERAFVLDEAHHVAMDAAHHLDEALRLPFRERLLPGQVEEVGMAGPRDQLQTRGHR